MFPFPANKLALLCCAALAIASLSGGKVSAQETEYDSRSAVIFAYFAIGDDENPSLSLRAEQFAAQIDEIVRGGYKVKPLPEILAVFARGGTLADRTIALTFDGADRSLLTHAAPLLEKHDIPYTVFIPAAGISSDKPPYLTWDELRRLKKTGLATFGLHPSSYARLSGADEEALRREINGALAAIRKELGVSPEIFSYPFGDYDALYKDILQSMGFKAAVGQQSGAAYAGMDMMALPRFTVTERYGDLERFIMAADTLPLPVTDISPSAARLDTQAPAIGFTVTDELKNDMSSLSCFSSDGEAPDVEIMRTRVEIRLKENNAHDRLRINCTLPGPKSPGERARTRWLGLLYTLPETEMTEEESRLPARVSAVIGEFINAE